MKDAYYFSHDANARNDPKICAMRSVYGAQGYGWYWIIIEMLREQADYRFPIDKYTDHTLALQMQCERNAATKFLHDCIEEFHLFKSDGEHFWSDSLCRRMARRDEKRKKAQAAAEQRWQNERNAKAMRTQCEGNAIKRKRKERKERRVVVEPHEQAVFDELALVPNYGPDIEKDIPFIRKLAADYPGVDLLAEAKQWAAYKLDKPLEKGKHSPRSQFRTWVSKAKPKSPPAEPVQNDPLQVTAAEWMRKLGPWP